MWSTGAARVRRRRSRRRQGSVDVLGREMGKVAKISSVVMLWATMPTTVAAGDPGAPDAGHPTHGPGSTEIRSNGIPKWEDRVVPMARLSVRAAPDVPRTWTSSRQSAANGRWCPATGAAGRCGPPTPWCPGSWQRQASAAWQGLRPTTDAHPAGAPASPPRGANRDDPQCDSGVRPEQARQVVASTRVWSFQRQIVTLARRSWSETCRTGSTTSESRTVTPTGRIPLRTRARRSRSAGGRSRSGGPHPRGRSCGRPRRSPAAPGTRGRSARS